MNLEQRGISPECFVESAVATFIVTPDHEVIFWNKACERLTGKTAALMVGTRNHWSAFYPSARPCLVDIVIDGSFSFLPELYEKFGKSKLAADGICAEGWYDNLGGRKRYVIFDAAAVFNPAGELVAAIETLQDVTELKGDPRAHLQEVRELQKKIAQSAALRGFVPICSSCKNIRNMDGFWVSLEEYFMREHELMFSHGICPKCVQKLYPEYYEKLMK